MFTIFSTQDVYVFDVGQKSNAAPNGNSDANIYIEDTDMKRNDTILSYTPGIETINAELIQRPMFMEKGGKLEEEYNDDFTDNVTQMTLGFKFFYIPPTING